MFINDDEIAVHHAEAKRLNTHRALSGHHLNRLVSSSGSREVINLMPMTGMPIFDPTTVARWRESMAQEKMHSHLMRLLKRTLIFAETTDDFRAFIVDHAMPMEYGPGQVVFRHGQEGNWMGIVIQGRVKKNLQREAMEIYIGDVGPGGIIGDLGLFGITPERSFTVHCDEKTVILVINCRVFEEAVGRGGGEFSLGTHTDRSSMRDLMQDTESFLKLRCFEGLDQDFIMTLRKNSEPRMGYPGETLMKEYHFGNEMFILRAGTVKILKDDKFVVELPAGVVFGELAVLGSDKRRTATVKSSALCLLRVLHADVFHSILAKFPAARRVFDHAYIARMVTVAVLNAKDELHHYDHFFGGARPKTTQELHDLVGSIVKVDEGSKVRASNAPSKVSLALPPLTPRGSPKKRSSSMLRSLGTMT